MSKTSFNISEQKTNVINFIKKHKNILSLDDGHTTITAEFIGKLAKSNNKEFFHLATDIQLKFGQNFYIFFDNCDEKHHMIQLWLPSFNKFASDTAIKEYCRSKSFADVIETHCNWYNMTPKRWETFEAIFDFYDKQKTSSKKTAKKTAKKTTKKTAKKTTNTADKAKALTLDDFKLFLNDIVFID
jgi:hypothetical protein